MDYSIDKNLLQGLCDNDDAAFKYLYQTSFITIHSIATNSSRNREDGEDLYNDGIIVLLDRIKKPDFVLNGKIQGLLYAICKKMNNNSLRKEKSKQNYLNGNFEDSHEEYLDEKMDRSLFRRCAQKEKQKFYSLLVDLFVLLLKPTGLREAVKANGIFLVPPQLDITICDIKISNSSLVN
jgi:DNA-directed RNA polymerase specialized sigma24 family protein